MVSLQTVMNDINSLNAEEQDNLAAYLTSLRLSKDDKFIDMLSVRLNANNAQKLDALEKNSK